MVSGVVTAIAFAEIRDSQEVQHVEGPSLTVLADRTDYKNGEPVTIRIVNSGSETIFFQDSSYGLQIRGLAGMMIFSPLAQEDGKRQATCAGAFART